MNSLRMLYRVAVTVLAVTACFSLGHANAQNYPTRAIQILVGFPPGGSSDIVARVSGEGLSRELGKPVIVENKTGATGIVAANAVATSRPDGYTLLLVPGGHALYGATFNTLPFDPLNSFEWISRITTGPFFVAVSGKSSIQSMTDLVAAGKASPGTLKFGSVGPGSPHHLGVELLSLATGTKFLHVPYRGEGPMVAALLASEIDFAMSTPTQVLGNVESGAVRALAVTSRIRSSKLPNVQSVEESLKLTDYNVGSWFALAGAAGTPPDIVRQINAALDRALKVQADRVRITTLGHEITLSSPQELREQVAKEQVMWAKIVEAAGVPKQ